MLEIVEGIDDVVEIDPAMGLLTTLTVFGLGDVVGGVTIRGVEVGVVGVGVSTGVTVEEVTPGSPAPFAVLMPPAGDVVVVMIEVGEVVVVASVLKVVSVVGGGLSEVDVVVVVCPSDGTVGSPGTTVGG